MIRDASGVFLTGGNQLRLSSMIGGTRLADAISTRFQAGAVVAGHVRRGVGRLVAHDRVRRLGRHAQAPDGPDRRRASGCCRASSSTSTSSSGTGWGGCSR